MSATHRVTFDVVCPTCGAKGKVIGIENGGVPFADTPRRKYLVGEFSVVPGNPTAVECTACGAKFRGDFL
jgi:hypothetical protein